MVKRIILHWSAGKYYPNELEKHHYHYLIDIEGNVLAGDFKPEDNEVCVKGHYAAHSGGGNTGSIGVCLCGMYNFRSKFEVGNYPIDKKQFEACMKFIAQLCKKYNLNINKKTVLTHYEFGIANPKTSSAGKIDINYLPPYPDIKAQDVGDFISSLVF